MSTYRLGTRAETDLEEIFDYTVDTWGEEQAQNYVDEFTNCFQLLADSPGMGRNSDLIHLGLRRFEHGKHVIFYKLGRHGINISRILHQRKLPSRAYFLET